MKRFARTVVGLLFVLGAGHLSAIAAVNPEFGYSVDLPIGWTQLENTDPNHIGFMSPNQDAMVQIIAFDPDSATDGVGIAELMIEQLSAAAIDPPDPFRYQRRSASLTDVRFLMGESPARGYLLTIDSVAADYVLLAFALVESYDSAHDHLISALDSFALGTADRQYPGAISQYFYPFPPPDERPQSIPFLGNTVPFEVDPGAVESTSVLVDREARILTPYQALDRPAFEAAWRRYFRQIYRDNYMRLADIAEEIQTRLQADGVPRVDQPARLLTWLQEFQYQRAGGVSDFLPPIVCLASATGDCDSLGMTYVILLHHMGFDAILMVSDRFSHALAAVDVHGPGARFEFEGRQWLVAELTADVPIGQIDARQADPSGWIGVRMRLTAHSR
jgi:hypothetical protein